MLVKRKVTAVFNKKGGTGKTTTAVNLACAVAKMGKKVLLVDLDPQGNATTSVGMRDEFRDKGAFEILRSGKVENLDVMGANERLGVFEEEAIKNKKTTFMLREKLRKEDFSAQSDQLGISGVKVCSDLDGFYDSGAGSDSLTSDQLFHVEQFEYVFIDCPPALSWLTLNGLFAADGVLIPMQCEFLAMDGLSQLFKVLELIKLKNHVCKVYGIVFTMFDERANMVKNIRKQVESVFPEKVFDTKIRRNVKLAEAPAYGMSGIEYDSKSSGASMYMNLAKEFLRRAS